MKFAVFICCVCVLFSLVQLCDAVSYEGWKTVHIVTPDRKTANLVHKIASNGVQLWLDPSPHRPAVVLIPPKLYTAIIRQLKREDVAFFVVDKDLQSIIDKEHKENDQAAKNSRLQRRSAANLSEITKRYPSLSEVETWLNAVHQKYPQNTKFFDMGQTFEKRPQKGIAIGDDGGQKPIIWIQSAIHAREWVTVPSSLNMIHQLLTSEGSKDLLDKYAWYVVPVTNPDGYVYSREADRLWRKNRRPLNSTCTGVDLNRNFGLAWGENPDKCSQAYPGTKAFSEPESRNIDAFMKTLGGRVKFFMDLHMYGRMWFYPWAHDSNKPIRDRDEVYRVAKAGTKAIRRLTQNRFRLGTPGDIMYNAYGSILDYMRGTMKVEFSYTAELSPGMYDGEGFLVSLENLPQVTEEIWTGVQAAVRAI